MDWTVRRQGGLDQKSGLQRDYLGKPNGAARHDFPQSGASWSWKWPNHILGGIDVKVENWEGLNTYQPRNKAARSNLTTTQTSAVGGRQADKCIGRIKSFGYSWEY